MIKGETKMSEKGKEPKTTGLRAIQLEWTFIIEIALQTFFFNLFLVEMKRHKNTDFKILLLLSFFVELDNSQYQ